MKGFLKQIKDFLDFCRVVAFLIFALNFIFLVFVTILFLFACIGSLFEGGINFEELINEFGDVPFKVLFLSLVVHIVTKEIDRITKKYIDRITKKYID